MTVEISMVMDGDEPAAAPPPGAFSPLAKRWSESRSNWPQN